MTVQEALKYIKLFREDWDRDSKTKNAMALDVSVKALEKQIAKKPIYKPANAIYKRPHCPLCNRELYAWNFQSGHCNCGQTIDCWENEGL